MVEYTIQYHPDTIFMKRITHFPEILIGSQTHIHLAVIPRIIAMCVRLEKR